MLNIQRLFATHFLMVGNFNGFRCYEFPFSVFSMDTNRTYSRCLAQLFFIDPLFFSSSFNTEGFLLRRCALLSVYILRAVTSFQLSLALFPCMRFVRASGSRSFCFLTIDSKAFHQDDKTDVSSV